MLTEEQRKDKKRWYGCIKDCAQYIFDLGYNKFKVTTIISNIPKSIKTNKPMFEIFTFEFTV